MIAGFVRGLSTRDVEAALGEALGPDATVSRSTVSRICEEIKDQFEAWSRRRLDDVRLATTCSWTARTSATTPTPPPSRCWPPGGIDTNGKPVFVGLDAAAAESGDAWAGFLADLGARACRARCWSSPTARPG